MTRFRDNRTGRLGLGALQQFAHAGNHPFQVSPNLEIPDAQDGPPGVPQLRVNPSVSPHVVRDLLVPVLAGPSGPVSRGMAVPERTIHEYGDAPPGPGDIRRPGRALVVAPPPPNTGGIERAPALRQR